MRRKSIRLERLTRLVMLKYYQLNTGWRAEKLSNEFGLFSQRYILETMCTVSRYALQIFDVIIMYVVEYIKCH